VINFRTELNQSRSCQEFSTVSAPEALTDNSSGRLVPLSKSQANNRTCTFSFQARGGLTTPITSPDRQRFVMKFTSGLSRHASSCQRLDNSSGISTPAAATSPRTDDHESIGRLQTHRGRLDSWCCGSPMSGFKAKKRRKKRKKDKLVARMVFGSSFGDSRHDSFSELSCASARGCTLNGAGGSSVWQCKCSISPSFSLVSK
jgi:hypothetical protein